MKNILLLLSIGLASLSTPIVNAQHLEIIPLVNYQFPAGVDASWLNPDSGLIEYGKFRINGDVNYGVGLNVPLPFKGVTISASFTTMNSSMEFVPNVGAKTPLFDATQEYWMFGVLREVDMDQLHPYGGFILGWTTIRPDDTGYQNATKFSVGLEGGIKYFITNSVGILLHARLLLPVQWLGAGFTIGTGGAGAGLTMSSSIIQGDIGGGIVFAIGKK